MSGFLAAQQIALRRDVAGTATCGGRLRCFRQNRGLQSRTGQSGATAYAVQEIGLCCLQRDKATEHVQHVEQFGRVARQPAGRLDVTDGEGVLGRR